MYKKETDFKAFIPIGFSFLTIGIVFLKKSLGLGVAFIALGVSWIIIGRTKAKKNNDGDQK